MHYRPCPDVLPDRAETAHACVKTPNFEPCFEPYLLPAKCCNRSQNAATLDVVFPGLLEPRTEIQVFTWGGHGQTGWRAKRTKTLKGSELLPWKNSRPLSADLVQTTLIFVPQYRQTLQVNLHWDVHIPKKTKKLLWFDIGLRQVC